MFIQLFYKLVTQVNDRFRCGIALISCSNKYVSKGPYKERNILNVCMCVPKIYIYNGCNKGIVFL